MRNNYVVRVFLAAGLITGLCAGCGNSLVSEHKRSVDRQAEAQKQLAENRADQLQDDVEVARKQSLNEIDARAKELDIKKDALTEERKEVDRRATFWKKDLDQQETASKNTIEHNADMLKDRIDESSARGTYGRDNK